MFKTYICTLKTYTCKESNNLRYTQIIFELKSNIIEVFSKGFESQMDNFVNMKVVQNIKEIRLKKGINQELIADALNFDIANWSRIENGKQELKVDHLEKVAKVLGVEVIDLFTYPEVYVNKNTLEQAERISVTFEVSPDKRDILLSLVTKKRD